MSWQRGWRRRSRGAGARPAIACPPCARWRARRAARRARRRARIPRSALAGIVAGRDRARLVVAAEGAARARAWPIPFGALRLAGSDDPALDLLLRAAGDSVAVVPGPRGSVAGLVHLARGSADAAAVHLRHAPSGRFNDPFVRAALPGERTVLVHLWQREQGLVVPPGNPLGIRGVADLPPMAAWRAPGTASRLLLERLLLEAGIDSQPGPKRPSTRISGSRPPRDRGCRCRPGGARGRPRRGARVDPRRH